MLQIKFDQIYLTLFYVSPLYISLKTFNCFKFCLHLINNTFCLKNYNQTHICTLVFTKSGSTPLSAFKAGYMVNFSFTPI